MFKEILIDYTKTINKFTKYRIYGIIGAFLTLIIPFLLYLNNSENKLDSEQSFCPIKMTIGFPCPSCGITKSLVYIYDGDFERAIHFHAYGPLVIFFCVFIIGLLTTEIITKKTYFRRAFFNKKLAYFLATTLFLYHIYRLYYFIKNNTIDDIIKESIWK